jgi:UDP-3-O-[3-hydroxymyristoyl] glucosamine N-acyltransferase
MLPLRLSEIAKLVGGAHIGPGDPEIRGAAGLAAASATDLSFVTDGRYLEQAATSAAGALIVGPEVEVDKPSIRVDDPYRAFVLVLRELQPDADRVFPPGVHPTAVIDASADVSAAAAIGPCSVIGADTVLGSGTRLGAHVSLGCDVVIGRDCLIYPQAVIREGCRLGDRVIVHAGVVIGSDGFGYLPGPDGMLKIPQVGVVCVGDDVELGAGVTVDRATTGRTVIGEGTKLDNQVQVAHNVQIGRHCALSAQTGIAGSCEIGDGVISGGQVGIGDHLKIGAGSQLGGQSGVTHDLDPGSRVFGTPALDSKESFRNSAATRRLPVLQETVRALKRRVAKLEKKLAAAENASRPPADQEN